MPQLYLVKFCKLDGKVFSAEHLHISWGNMNRHNDNQRVLHTKSFFFNDFTTLIYEATWGRNIVNFCCFVSNDNVREKYLHVLLTAGQWTCPEFFVPKSKRGALQNSAPYEILTFMKKKNKTFASKIVKTVRNLRNDCLPNRQALRGIDQRDIRRSD